MLSGEVKDVVLVDVTPLTLGVETKGGVMTKLIPRNTAIPCDKMEVFTTAVDFQTMVEIHVLQGEREMASDNRTLGKFHLTDIPPAPAGMPQIEVKFDIDSNGILHVTAKDRATSKSQTIQITASTNLDKSDVERAVREAESHAADDKTRRDLVELRNRADQISYQAEKTLKDAAEKVTADQKQKVEAAVAAVREASAGDDQARIKAEIDRLQAVLSEVAQALYQAAAGPEGAPGAGAPPPPPGGNGKHPSGDPNVVDAEYKVQED